MSFNAIPSDRAYYISGIGHLNCAKIVVEYLKHNSIAPTDSTRLALSNIVGFALESALKAYLSNRGVSRIDLKKKRLGLGHNLQGLFNRAQEMGLENAGASVGHPELSAALSRYISLCGDNYENFDYRYLESEEFSLLREGVATSTVLKAIEVVLDISIQDAAR